jgi:hypothetical protein
MLRSSSRKRSGIAEWAVACQQKQRSSSVSVDFAKRSRGAEIPADAIKQVTYQASISIVNKSTLKKELLDTARGRDLSGSMHVASSLFADFRHQAASKISSR